VTNKFLRIQINKHKSSTIMHRNLKNNNTLYCFSYVLRIFSRGRDRVRDRDGSHGDDRRCFCFFFLLVSWSLGGVEVGEEEIEGRDVMDALEAGAPATHGTRPQQS
jgi:hypothetical protein